MNDDILLIGTAVGLLIIICIGFAFFITAYQRKRIGYITQNHALESEKLELSYRNEVALKEKELENLKSLQAERDRISSDMHDDLGSGLSSIKLISEMLKMKHSEPETQNDLNEILTHATELTSTMREMVWSLNPRNDYLEKFVPHLQQYAKHFFEPSSIHCIVHIPTDIASMEMNGFLRRNLFLCYKEILNNIMKHSNASNVHIDITILNKILYIKIHDDGVGITNKTHANNGFYTMKKRINDCNGTIDWGNTNPGFGTTIEINL